MHAALTLWNGHGTPAISGTSIPCAPASRTWRDRGHVHLARRSGCRPPSSRSGRARTWTPTWSALRPRSRRRRRRWSTPTTLCWRPSRTLSARRRRATGGGGQDVRRPGGPEEPEPARPLASVGDLAHDAAGGWARRHRSLASPATCTTSAGSPFERRVGQAGHLTTSERDQVDPPLLHRANPVPGARPRGGRSTGRPAPRTLRRQRLPPRVGRGSPPPCPHASWRLPTATGASWRPARTARTAAAAAAATSGRRPSRTARRRRGRGRARGGRTQHRRTPSGPGGPDRPPGRRPASARGRPLQPGDRRTPGHLAADGRTPRAGRLQRIGLSTRAGAALYAMEHGLVGGPG